MARTAFSARVIRALRFALALDRRGISNREGIERRDDLAFRLSRRRCLGVALGAASLAACDGAHTVSSAVRASSSRGAGARVLVVGAGLAGLTAAWRVKRAGLSPVVYDAGGRVGGRTFSLREHFPSKCELGGELIDSNHEAIRALATELGVALIDVHEPTSHLEHERYVLGAMRYTEAQVLDLFRALIPAVRRDLDALGNHAVNYAHHTPSAEALDALSLGGWFDRNGVRGSLRSLLDVAFVSELGREAYELSALSFLLTVGTEADDLSLYGTSDERFVVREGSDALATRLAQRLGAAVVLGHRLVAVRARDNGAIECVFEVGAGTREVTADRVILALPFNQLRRCELGFEMPTAKRRAITELPYGTNTKVMISTRGRPWRDAGSSGSSFNDSGVYHVSWESTRGFDGEVAIMTSYTGGRLGVSTGESNPEAQGRHFAEALDAVFPGTAAVFTGRAARMYWPGARYFEGSYACYGPSDWTRLAGAEAPAVGAIHFAGEHTSSVSQGFMNGAVESGERAAREVLSALGVSLRT